MAITRRLARVAEDTGAHVYTPEGERGTIRKTSFREGRPDTALMHVEKERGAISSRWIELHRIRPGRELLRLIRQQDRVRDAERAQA